MSIFSSDGLKRKIAALLTAVIPLLEADPNFSYLVPYVIHIAGLLGVTGLTHAAGSRTLDQHKLASLAALLSSVLTVAQYIPALAPYLPILTQVAGFVSALAVGCHVGAK